MVANILPTDPLPALGWGQNTTFSKHGIVVYQIKWDHECSNMVANICPYTAPDPGGGVIWSKFNHENTWSCCISNKRESRMHQHGSKYFARRPQPTT